MHGVCRTISPTGPFQGLIAGRFILALLSNLFSVLSKALSVGMVLHFLDKDAPGCYCFCHNVQQAPPGHGSD